MRSPDLHDARFRKSSYSIQDDCVEVATNIPGVVAVRDSKNPSGPVLKFTPKEWREFLDSLR